MLLPYGASLGVSVEGCCCHVRGASLCVCVDGCCCHVHGASLGVCGGVGGKGWAVQ